jgi:DNA-binding CsgD family transcriptional regulator
VRVVAESATSVAVDRLAGQQEDGAKPGAERVRTCLASLDPALSVVAANDEFFSQFGRTSADVCGRNVYELLHPGTRPLLDRHFARLAEGRGVRFAERVLAIRGTDGVFAGELTGMAVHGEDDQLTAIVVLMRPDLADGEPPVIPEQARPRSRNGKRKPLLTPLDARILEGIAAGASTVQLASRLYLSRQGVEYHVGSMLRKLRVANRAALVSKAYSMGLLAAGIWPPKSVPEEQS